jgi:tripartite-type tricarboxylate transporter receptor subunit TctC
MFDTVSSSIEHIKAGKLRPLAVTTATKLGVLPGVPTVAEALPGYEVISVQGIGAPKNTPSEIVERLHTVLSNALGDATIQARFAELGIEVLGTGPAEFGKLIIDETEKWAKVVNFAGVKAE